MNYNHIFSCRLSDTDSEQLRSQAAKFKTSPSEYIRYLIRIPVDAKQDSGTHCIVLDTDSLASISHELIKWGYHYNQAVHSMNTISMFVRRGRVDTEYFTKAIGDIEQTLRAIEEEQKSLRARISDIQKSVLIGGL